MKNIGFALCLVFSLLALVRPGAAAPTFSDPLNLAPATAASEIETFEGEFVWFADACPNAEVECQPVPGGSQNGTTAMQMIYLIPTDGWGGCWRYYAESQDWSNSTGLTLWVRAGTPNTNFTLVVYSGEEGAATPFEAKFRVASEWDRLSIRWDAFKRAPWADAEGLQTLDPVQITRIGFALEQRIGELWVDDMVAFTGDAPAPAPTLPAEPAEAPRGRRGLCASAPLGLSFLGVGLLLQRRARKF